MRTTIQLLLAGGLVGGIDVAYFHLYRFRLYSRRSSRRENVTHSVRGLVFPIAMATLVAGEPRGGWFWLIFFLLLVDAANNVADVMFEPASRAPIGVPPRELALHAFGLMIGGAVYYAFLWAAWAGRSAPTALLPHPEGWLSPAVRAAAWVATAGATLLWLFENALFARTVLGSRGSATALAGRGAR